MKKYIYLIFSIFLLIACKKLESNLDVSAYQNAVKHLPQNLDKFLGKKIISQKWNDKSFFFKTKSDTIFKSFKIDVNDLKVVEEKYPKKNNLKTSFLEFISPSLRALISILSFCI